MKKVSKQTLQILAMNVHNKHYYHNEFVFAIIICKLQQINTYMTKNLEIYFYELKNYYD